MTAHADLSKITIFNEKAAPLEKQILATLLDSPSLYDNIADIIEANDFIGDHAKQLFSWIRSQIKGLFEVSPALAMSRFAGSPSESYLLDVLCEMVSETSLKSHAEELRDLATRRAMLISFQSIGPDFLKTDIPVDSTISRMSEAITLGNSRLVSNKDAIRSYADVGETWSAKFKETIARGGMSGTPCGFHELDEILAGLQPSDLIIVGGRPSMGKTTFSMNMIEHISLAIGGNCLVFSLEMPSEGIYQRSLASVGGIDYADLRNGRLKVGDDEKLALTREKLANASIFIDDTAGLTLNQLSARAIRQDKETPLSAIMIDYLQLMQFSQHYIGNPNLGVSEITRGLKQLAKLLGVPIIALSQLSRSLETRPNKRPINSDLRDSGSIEQDADVIMFVYRDEVYNPETEFKGIAEIIIGKHRNGSLGTVLLDFGGAQSSFRNRKNGGNASSTLAQAKKKSEIVKFGDVKSADMVDIESQLRVDKGELENSPPDSPDHTLDNIPF